MSDFQARQSILPIMALPTPSRLDQSEAEFVAVTTTTARRGTGITFTPQKIVDAMLTLIGPEYSEAAFVDCGAGVGRFSLAVAARFPAATVAAIEKNDGLAARLKEALVEYADRVEVRNEDFLRCDLSASGCRVFVGNPPYVRHHGICASDKAWLASMADEMGLKVSGLAGMHAYFLLRCLSEGKPGDRILMILPSEWLEARYGAAIKRLLIERCRSVSMYFFPPEVSLFEGVMTTSVILDAVIGEEECILLGARLGADGGMSNVSWVRIEGERSYERNWRELVFRDDCAATEDTESGSLRDLGSFCRVHRGQVTGMNAIWIANERTASLIPVRYLHPCITDAAEIFSVAGELLEAGHVRRRVIDLPEDLSDLSEMERAGVEEFLSIAHQAGADQSYVARHRRAWWRVGLREPAPIIMSYMARRAPRFLINRCRASLINVAHGIYPRMPMSEQELLSLVRWLNEQAVRQSVGRIYSGGLRKIEPGDACRLRVPESFQALLAEAA